MVGEPRGDHKWVANGKIWNMWQWDIILGNLVARVWGPCAGPSHPWHPATAGWCPSAFKKSSSRPCIGCNRACFRVVSVKAGCAPSWSRTSMEAGDMTGYCRTVRQLDAAPRMRGLHASAKDRKRRALQPLGLRSGRLLCPGGLVHLHHHRNVADRHSMDVTCLDACNA